ncbi:MAG TPA: choice-of-anchor D domain-containing protein, partial [Acidimicrobiales bacterium]
MGLASSASAAAPAAVRAETVILNFGSVSVGATAAAQAAIIHNVGPGTATGLKVGSPSDPQFRVLATTCPSSLAANATCTITIDYVPAGTASHSGEVRVTTASGGATRVALDGSPDLVPSPFRVTPTSFDFGPVALNTTVSQSVTLTNADPANHTITTTLDPLAHFSVTTTCAPSPRFIQHGGSCSYTIAFHPVAAGDVSESATLSVDITDGATYSYPITLRGHGGTTGTFPLSVTGSTLDFGPLAVGTTSSGQDVTIKNQSAATVNMVVAGGAVTDGFANGPSNCGASLGAGASCVLDFTATPIYSGLNAGSTAIQITVPGFPRRDVTIALTAGGTGAAPRLVASPTWLDLGSPAVGHSGASSTIRITNTSSVAVTGI